jgi:lauroyl/myristoyl acyltransferase
MRQTLRRRCLLAVREFWFGRVDAGLIRLLARLPAPASDLLCAIICRVGYTIVGFADGAEQNLRHALRCPPAQARSLLYQQYTNVLRARVDLQRWLAAPRRHEPSLGAANERYLNAALARGNGAVLVTVHTVGIAPTLWPLAASVQASGLSIGIVVADSPLASVRTYPPAFDRPSAVRNIMRELAHGGLVLVWADALWYPGRRAWTQRFLNADCRFPIGPIAIARLSQASIVPFIALRAGPGKYAIEIFPPLDPPARDDHAGDGRVIDSLLVLYERAIRAHPEQYLTYPWLDPNAEGAAAATAPSVNEQPAPRRSPGV